jgi:excisionase family DNA binding protein
VFPHKPTYTVAEVADYWHVSPRTVYLWIQSGKLRGAKVRGKLRIRRETIDGLLKAGRREREGPEVGKR